MASNRELTSKECRHVGESLSAYLDGQLGEKERALIESHLPDCPQCSAELSDLRCLVDAMRTTAPVRPPRSFLLSPTMVEEKRRRSWFDIWSALAPAMAGVAALLLAALLFVDYRLYPDNSGLASSAAPPTVPAAEETTVGLAAAPFAAEATALTEEPALSPEAFSSPAVLAAAPSDTPSTPAAAAFAATEPAGSATEGAVPRSAPSRPSPEAATAPTATVAPVTPAAAATEAEAPLTAQGRTTEEYAAPEAAPLSVPPPSAAPVRQPTVEAADAAAGGETAESSAAALEGPPALGATADGGTEQEPAPEAASLKPAATADTASGAEEVTEPASLKVAPDAVAATEEPMAAATVVAAAPADLGPATAQPLGAPASARSLSTEPPLLLRLGQVLAAVLLLAATLTWSVRLIRRRA